MPVDRKGRVTAATETARTARNEQQIELKSKQFFIGGILQAGAAVGHKCYVQQNSVAVRLDIGAWLHL
jgi:hypothetical protein